MKPDMEFPSDAAVMIRTAPTVNVASPQDIQKIMLQLDEQQFMAEVMGEALEKWFYSFKVGGKLTEGVSAKGAHEFARLRAEQGFFIRFPMDGIRYEECEEMGEQGVRATVIARDGRSHAEAIGVAFYPYMVERDIKNSQGVVIRTVKEFDRFAGRKAMSVAERNAILRLIPEKTVLSALKLRAQIVAANEVEREAHARLAAERRPEAPRVVASAPQPALEPYAAPAKAPAPVQEMTLPQAKLLPLMGKPESWNNHGTKTLHECPDTVLKQARAFFTAKLTEQASPRMAEQLAAIALVLADREAYSPQMQLAPPAESLDDYVERVLTDADDGLPFD